MPATCPGRYAVEALDACYLPGGPGLAGAKFALAALVVIGIAACVAGSRMFRWDAGQKLPPGAKPWIAFALAAWAAVGLTAERTGRLAVPIDQREAAPGCRRHAGSRGLARQDITPAQVQAITFDDLPRDDGVVAPVAQSLDDLSPDSRERVDGIRKRLEGWPPGQQGDLVQRVRNLLSAAAVFDVLEDPDEGAVGYVVLDYIRQQVTDRDLERVLTYIIENPTAGSVVTQASGLGIEGQITEGAARERTVLYALKLLKRVLGK